VRGSKDHLRTISKWLLITAPPCSLNGHGAELQIINGSINTTIELCAPYAQLWELDTNDTIHQVQEIESFRTSVSITIALKNASNST